MKRKEKVEITATIKRYSANASNVLIYDHDTGKEVWLPCSQIAITDSRLKNGEEVATISMPEWLAIKEELV